MGIEKAGHESEVSAQARFVAGTEFLTLVSVRVCFWETGVVIVEFGDPPGKQDGDGRDGKWDFINVPECVSIALVVILRSSGKY